MTMHLLAADVPIELNIVEDLTRDAIMWMGRCVPKRFLKLAAEIKLAVWVLHSMKGIIGSCRSTPPIGRD